jgi:hypothetical protein
MNRKGAKSIVLTALAILLQLPSRGSILSLIRLREHYQVWLFMGRHAAAACT